VAYSYSLSCIIIPSVHPLFVLSVGSEHVLWKNGRIDRDAIRANGSSGPKESCVRCGFRSPLGIWANFFGKWCDINGHFVEQIPYTRPAFTHCTVQGECAISSAKKAGLPFVMVSGVGPWNCVLDRCAPGKCG